MTQAERPNPESNYRSIPIALRLEPPGTSPPELASQLAREDPRILPALGVIANTAPANDQLSKVQVALAAFLLGRQYEQAHRLAEHFNLPDAPEPPIRPTGETGNPPAA